MRVICIDDKDFILNVTRERGFCPLIQGKYYDVELCPKHGKEGYLVNLPLPFSPHNCKCITYKRFSITSEICETSFANAEPIESTLTLIEL